MKKVLILFETSGAVFVPFKLAGFDVLTIDLLPHRACNDTHICYDIFNIDDLHLNYSDFCCIVCFFPCTFFSKAGLYLLKKQPGRKELQQKYLQLFLKLWSLPIKYKIFENPRGSALNKLFKPASCHFDYSEYCPNFKKAESLWLDNLPPLLPEFINSKTDWGNFITKMPYRKGQYNPRDYTPIEFGYSLVKQYRSYLYV